MFFPSREIVDRVRHEYPAGTRVELLSMNDPYREMPSGLKGTVSCVDDTATIFVNWDNGSHLGVVYGEDSCRRLNTVTTICYGETKIWDSRADAEAFFLEGMTACEGSEKERYTNVYLALKSGLPVCRDTEEKY